MSDGYVLAGYGITAGTLALYALRVLTRARSLSRSLRERPSRPDGLSRIEREEAG